MNRIQHILLELIKAGLAGETPSTEDYPITNSEWKLLFYESMKQTVQGVVYDALLRLPSNCCPPEDIFNQWKYAAQGIEQKYLAHLKLVSYLTIRYELEAGLTPVVLKGLGLSAYYPIPNHRMAGDIDLYFGGTADSEKIDRLMERWGMKVSRGDEDSVFVLNGVVIENHSQLITSHHPLVSRRTKEALARQIAEGSAFQTIMLENTTLKVPVPVINHLLLLTHSLKHVLNEGIGLRQICDVAVLLKAEKANTDGEVLCQLLKEWGIYKWANLVYSFCVEYLGVKVEELPYTFQLSAYRPSDLLQEVWKSGNFGQMDERMAQRAPEGDSVFTAKRIFSNAWRFMRYAPGDAVGLPLDYTIGYLKNKLIGKNKK